MNSNFNYRSCLILAILCVLHGDRSDAFQSDVSNPTQLGFDNEILGGIDDLMQTAVAEEKMVGCSAMILKDGQVCYFKAWGKRDREQDLPMKRDTIFRIYSMTKPITSVAIMQLVEQGKIELDAPVSKYLPEFETQLVLETDESENGESFKEVPARRSMSVRDLLRHTSGLTYGFFGNSEVDQRYRRAGILRNDRDLEEFVTNLAKLPLKHQPGARFEYSVSTDVLGRLVEVASGNRFDRYLKTEIFDPIKMVDTSFVVPLEKQSRFAQIYRRAQDGELKPRSSRSQSRYRNQENLFFSGGGGLCSTIDDYMCFCQMLLNGGRVEDRQVVKPETLQQMFNNQLDGLDEPPGRFKFGLGFRISPQKDFGWGGAAGTRFWVNPGKRLAMIFMVQINPYRARFGGEMREIVYRALSKTQD